MQSNLPPQALATRQAATAVSSPLKKFNKLPAFGTPEYKALSPELQDAVSRADHFNGIDDKKRDAAIAEINEAGYRSRFLSLDH